MFAHAGINGVMEILRMFYYHEDPISQSICVVHMLVSRASHAGNISFICLISTERFLSVFFPFQSKARITASKVKKVS